MTTTAPAVPQRPDRGRVAAVAALVAVVVGIIAVAFRGSWGSLRDAALACHFDRSAADLYPFAVDGLLVVAILAAVLLRHDGGARRYCLWVIGAYTGASWLINYLHGLGMFSPDPATRQVSVPPWPVVLVIASLVIGSIFLGSHLLIFVWRHVFPENLTEPDTYQSDTDPDGDAPPVPELPADAFEVAKDAYRQSLHPDLKTLSQLDLIERFRISKREASRVQNEVKAEQARPADVDDLVDRLDEPGRNGQGAA